MYRTIYFYLLFENATEILKKQKQKKKVLYIRQLMFTWLRTCPRPGAGPFFSFPPLCHVYIRMMDGGSNKTRLDDLYTTSIFFLFFCSSLYLLAGLLRIVLFLYAAYLLFCFCFGPLKRKEKNVKFFFILGGKINSGP